MRKLMLCLGDYLKTFKYNLFYSKIYIPRVCCLNKRFVIVVVINFASHSSSMTAQLSRAHKKHCRCTRLGNNFDFR